MTDARTFDQAALLATAVTIAKDAGALVKARRAEGVEVAASKSSLEDVVTFADRESEALIRAAIKAARPEDGFFGEESGAEVGTSGLTWVVDPIDGTVNYLYGFPHYAISIAVVEGEPDPLTWHAVAAVVFNPASGELYTATDGGGAFLDGTPISVASEVQFSQALVGTGFSYSSEARVAQAAVIGGLLGEVRDIRRMGTASLDLCAVATGRLNAYFERGLQPWDHAAGALIAREAGAHVGGLNGAPASAGFILAAEPALAVVLERKLLAVGV